MASRNKSKKGGRKTLKRKMTAEQKRVAAFMKKGYSMKDAWRMVKKGKKASKTKAKSKTKTKKRSTRKTAVKRKVKSMARRRRRSPRRRSAPRRKKNTIRAGKLIATLVGVSQISPNASSALMLGAWDRVFPNFMADLSTLPQNPGRAVKAVVPFVAYGLGKNFLSRSDREIVDMGNLRVTI